MKNWELKEQIFRKEYLRKYESIMCVGNGYMGVRAATEEDYNQMVRYTLVAGTFDNKKEENIPELPNSADTTAFSLMANGITLQLTQNNITCYERSLNLYNGILKRQFIWRPEPGVQLLFSSERFVSLEERHVLGYKVSIKVLEGTCKLLCQSGITGGARYGSLHFKMMNSYEQDGIMQYTETTHQSNIMFVTSAVVEGRLKNKLGAELPLNMIIKAEQEQVVSSCDVILEEGEEICIEKLCRIATTRDKEFMHFSSNINEYEKSSLLALEKTEMNKLRERGYDKTWKLSEDCWRKFWDDKDVMISGNTEEAEKDQFALRFAIYHLKIMSPIHDNRMNIGAKGLSGEGYFGHTFWDTEIYMLPFWTLVNPKGARSLLEYRYQSLDSARKNAILAGYEGAKYPWEAAWITDKDACLNRHTHFMKYEIHVTADVAYGVHYYYKITHDIEFMLKYGCEILFETAQFWKSRMQYNEEKDVYEICNVIGPDEYTHEANNNAYTNYLAHLNLCLAIEWKQYIENNYPKDYERLTASLNLHDRIVEWEERRDKLILAVPNEDDIIPQDDDYMTLPEIDLSLYRNKVKKLRDDYPYPTYTRLKVSKQADVMNLFLLLEELFEEKVKRASLEYYEPFCVHESSLSLCAYSMLASDCGKNEKAYQLFLRARDIDLDLKNDSEQGIHAASLGGIWQCCIRGFAGLHVYDNQFCIKPNLPKHWDMIKFRVWLRGSQIEVCVMKDTVSYKVLQGSNEVEKLISVIS